MTFPLEGGCSCGAVRYRMEAPPIIVHCCHCRYCQRQTGTAFALNALVETDRVTLLQGAPEAIVLPTESGRGQRVARCAQCRIALWSHYGGGGAAIRFVRVGTLEAPHTLAPDVHIYTASRQPWFALPDGARTFEAFYDPRTTFSPDAAARYRAAKLRHGEPLPPWLQ
ncbi:GFA family protein [Vulcaniibacterium thermophilum]|uniref:CENP-V/GFA domain-containing protein n=1 Tax=Vulcaniibacterium thermophilum TaxID=1169913 RepID=A0A919D9H2_9GAMM|nr:GFA family protein [Vulcaniibacterium thermophilum]GHE27104.1 hypothetical protein GCM10007167_05470 [Vulcaniibacterium thermophilum]